jgi:hypothetical protein
MAAWLIKCAVFDADHNPAVSFGQSTSSLGQSACGGVAGVMVSNRRLSSRRYFETLYLQTVHERTCSSAARITFCVSWWCAEWPLSQLERPRTLSSWLSICLSDGRSKTLRSPIPQYEIGSNFASGTVGNGVIEVRVNYRSSKDTTCKWMKTLGRHAHTAKRTKTLPQGHNFFVRSP